MTVFSEANQSADALVLFGMTGDLAHKKIFPALYGMARRGVLQARVVGVASSRIDTQQLHERIRKSIAESGKPHDEAALASLLERVSYVSGDYNDPSVFQRLEQALRGCDRPVHYLAIPPGLFETVINGLANAGLSRRGRVILEKPIGRDLASARLINRISCVAFSEDSICRIDHYLS